MTFEIHEERLEEMSDAWYGPAHSKQAHPPIGSEISNVRVMIGEPKAPLDLHRP